MMEELLDLYRKVPLMEALVRAQLPEMRCQVHKEKVLASIVERFGTLIVSLTFIVVYGFLCYLGMVGYSELQL